MTNKEFFKNVIEANISTEVTDKAKALLATVEKKSASKAKAQTENAKANLAIAKELISKLTEGNTYAVSEVIAITKTELSTAKVSAVFKVAVAEGLLTVCTGYKVGGKGRAVNGYTVPKSAPAPTEGEGETEGEIEGE